MNCYICEQTFDPAVAQQLTSVCIFNEEHIIRHRCPHCDVVFGNERMLNLSKQELGKEYDQLYQNYSEKDGTMLELALLKSISPNPNNEKLFLNWGCGATNKTLKLANDCGYRLLGFDVTTPNSDLMINNLELIADGTVDGIISNNLIEHMQNPVLEFLQMSSKLKTGGLMIHATPCWTYCVEFTRFHLFFLEGRSLDVLCAKTGFKLLPHYPHYVTSDLFGYPNVNSNVKIFKKL